ncbi:MAG: triose-phosphate isomerase [Bacteroidota bacterium]
MRKKLVAGNWKMNTSFSEAQKLASEVANMVKDETLLNGTEVVICVPFPYLHTASQLTTESPVQVGAQNCSDKPKGAYTGETSTAMLASMKVPYVIIGHSERREYFSEDNQVLAAKTDIALADGLTPIFCCGESLETREADNHFSFVCQQLTESLFHLSEAQISKIVIAYEPIWAIGTGKTASAEQAQEMHEKLREHLAGKYGADIAEDIPILYGGSVKPANAKEIFAGKDVDGGLVGGASLDARGFTDIVKAI